jgi:hypothetical protein
MRSCLGLQAKLANKSSDCSRDDFVLADEHPATGARGAGRGQHPLQDAVTQHESVKQRGARMQADERKTRRSTAKCVSRVLALQRLFP